MSDNATIDTKQREIRDNVIRAATLDIRVYVNGNQFIDPTAQALNQLLVRRIEIANMILKGYIESPGNHSLTDEFELINHQIKLIIGL